MNTRTILTAARLLSALFNPLYLPIVGLTILFLFTNFSYYPILSKIVILIIAYLFTILFPSLLIRAYGNYNGWTPIQLGQRERRVVPYAISIFCYFSCFYLMKRLHIPHFMAAIIIAALFIQIACAIVNVRWKISTHMAAIGGVAGAVMAFAHFFIFNPSWWLSVVICVAGMVGTSRMVLRQHSLSEVVAGFLIGLVCAFTAIIIM